MMIEKLLTIAKKDTRLILGLMSGTSLDGLDLALCKLKGYGKQTLLELIHFTTYPYTSAFRNDIRAIFAKPEVDMAKLCAMNICIANVHAQMVKQALMKWELKSEAVDLIASHGQTIFHAPQSLTGNLQYPNSTLQLGDGDHIAVQTGIITVSDFRQKHLAAGGEGAPLVVYGDTLLFTHETESRILLNIGGIANFTYLPAAAQANGKSFATDIGPGNTLMNQYMQSYFDMAYDENGTVASSGQINTALLYALYRHPFFDLPFPKTTGPELFNLAYLKEAQERSNTIHLPPEDVMATLTSFTAHVIYQAITKTVSSKPSYKVFISGGGYHNHFLMQQLRDLLKAGVCYPFDVLGLNSDAKEAALFALLANETIGGSPANMQGGEGAPMVCLGKISLPR